MNEYKLEKPYLQIYVLYHKKSSLASQLPQKFFSYFTRDHKNPLHRTLGIPVYIYDLFQNVKKGDYKTIDINSARHTIIIGLIDNKIKLDQNFCEYLDILWEKIENITTQHRLILIALEESGLKIIKESENMKSLKYYEFPKRKKIRLLMISILNVICQILRNDFELSINSQTLISIKLFLSHAKKDGADPAKKIRDYIHNKTQLDSFFDFNKIQYGMNILKVINENINNSCLIAIQTDKYSTREWCRLEALTAKLNHCPMIVVNCLIDREDRSFPYMGNVPTIRWNAKKNERIIDIIELALYEMLRCLYNRGFLDNLCKFWKIEDNCFLLYKAPEILTCILAAEKRNNQDNFILLYPDPPLGFEEINLLKRILPKVSFSTPTQLLRPIQNMKIEYTDSIIGISISESPDLPINGITDNHLIDVFVEICRYILASKCRLAYGGDLKKYSFTKILFNLTREYILREKKPEYRFINYLSWPFSIQLKEKQEANLKEVAIIKKIYLPNDLKNYTLKKKIQRNKVEDKYLFARALTRMRVKMNNEIQCRIIIGGNMINFLGKYPGLIEEAYLALNSKQPVFLVGAFGGATKLIIEAIKGDNHQINDLEKELKTTNYKGFFDYYNQQIINNPKIKEDTIDFLKLSKFFNNIGIEGLNNGLTIEENLKLFETINTNEIVKLILKGLKFLRLI